MDGPDGTMYDLAGLARRLDQLTDLVAALLSQRDPTRDPRSVPQRIGTAVAIVMDEPELSDRQIAMRANLNPSQLSRSEIYQLVATVARSPRNVQRGFITSGALDAGWEDRRPE